MAVFHDVSALKAVNANNDTVNRMKQFGLLVALSVSAFSLFDAVVPADASGYEELVIVSILFICGVAARSWPQQRAVKKQRDFTPVAVACCVSDDLEVDSKVAAECRGNDAGGGSMAADPLPTTIGSYTHDEVDVECVTPSEPQLEKDVEDPVCQGTIAHEVVNAVAKLGDPSRVDDFFNRMEIVGLEPSHMMRNTLMSICLRKSDAIRAENFLVRLLRVSDDCDISALTVLAQSCAEANDLVLTDNLDAAYSALVHTCVLLEA